MDGETPRQKLLEILQRRVDMAPFEVLVLLDEFEAWARSAEPLSVKDAEIVALIRDSEVRHYILDCVEERYTDPETGPIRDDDPASLRNRVWHVLHSLNREEEADPPIPVAVLELLERIRSGGQTSMIYRNSVINIALQMADNDALTRFAVRWLNDIESHYMEALKAMESGEPR